MVRVQQDEDVLFVVVANACFLTFDWPMSAAVCMHMTRHRMERRAPGRELQQRGAPWQLVLARGQHTAEAGRRAHEAGGHGR